MVLQEEIDSYQNKIKLHPYEWQQELIESIIEILTDKSQVLVQLGTGCGKSILCGILAQYLSRSYDKVYIVAGDKYLSYTMLHKYCDLDRCDLYSYDDDDNDSNILVMDDQQYDTASTKIGDQKVAIIFDEVDKTLMSKHIFKYTDKGKIKFAARNETLKKFKAVIGFTASMDRDFQKAMRSIIPDAQQLTIKPTGQTIEHRFLEYNSYEKTSDKMNKIRSTFDHFKSAHNVIVVEDVLTMDTEKEYLEHFENPIIFRDWNPTGENFKKINRKLRELQESNETHLIVTDLEGGRGRNFNL